MVSAASLTRISYFLSIFNNGFMEYIVAERKNKMFVCDLSQRSNKKKLNKHGIWMLWETKGIQYQLMWKDVHIGLLVFFPHFFDNLNWNWSEFTKQLNIPSDIIKILLTILKWIYKLVYKSQNACRKINQLN